MIRCLLYVTAVMFFLFEVLGASEGVLTGHAVLKKTVVLQPEDTIADFFESYSFKTPAMDQNINLKPGYYYFSLSEIRQMAAIPGALKIRGHGIRLYVRTSYFSRRTNRFFCEDVPVREADDVSGGKDDKVSVSQFSSDTISGRTFKSPGVSGEKTGIGVSESHYWILLPARYEDARYIPENTEAVFYKKTGRVAVKLKGYLTKPYDFSKKPFEMRVPVLNRLFSKEDAEKYLVFF